MRQINYKNGILTYAVFSFLLLFFAACATYYQKNESLMNAVYAGNFEVANKYLQDDAKWEKHKKNKLLFYLNKGTVLWMQGDYANSNAYFSKADYFIEDNNKKIGDAVLTMLVNAKYTTYGGENFEQILLHYYSALNYLQLGQTDEALVEGKRMLESMQRITDKYQKKNAYKRDAFAHNLIGLIYDARHEYNDAFIAYKNAYEIYKEDYQTQFETPIPVQLKKDLLRTAKILGFSDELKKFESEFNMKAEKSSPDTGDLLFFWNNGMGPVKDQMSINIMIIPYGKGWVQFVNPELGISIPFRVDDDGQNKDLLDMKFIRMALPKYVSRIPYYSKAQVVNNNNTYPLETAENINAIAFKSLSDRMLRELSIGVMRVALKQLAVFKAQQSKDQQALAAAALLYGAFSEQADTRNWQLLPYSINYTRIPLETTPQKVQFEAYNTSNIKGTEKSFEVNLKKGQTKFITVQTTDFTGYGGRTNY